VEPRAPAPAERRAGVGDRVHPHAGELAQRPCHDRLLRGQLIGARDVLPLAASAAPRELRTRRLDARRAGHHDLRQLGARERRRGMDDPGADPVAGRRARHERHPSTGVAAHAIAAGRQGCDVEIDRRHRHRR